MKLWFLSIVFLVVLPHSAYSQNLDEKIQLAFDTDNSENSSPISATGENNHSQSHTSQQNPPPLSIMDINVRTSISYPSFSDYWNTYASQPRHIYRARYRGLYGLAIKHITRVFSRFYKNYSQEYWRQQSYSDFYQSEYRQFKLDESDFNNRWWERDFFQSFEIENGGSEIIYYDVGKTYDIASLGPLVITNAGRIQWDGWRFSISHDREKDINPQRDEFGNEINTTETRARSFSFGISPPKGNLITTSSWTLSGAVNINLKIDRLNNNGTTFRGRLEFIGYYGKNPIPWLGIQLEGIAKPIREEYGLNLSIMMIQF